LEFEDYPASNSNLTVIYIMGNSLVTTCCIDQSKVQDTLGAKKGLSESQEIEVKLKKTMMRESGGLRT
jgi:tRNA A-37 threonylcarbamoyl transferase component Bud32